jgi:hypothetical protein
MGARTGEEHVSPEGDGHAEDHLGRLMLLRALLQVAALVLLTTIVIRAHTPLAVRIVGAGIAVFLAATAQWARRRLGLPPMPARRLWWRRGFIALFLLLIAVAIALHGGVGTGVALALSFCAVIAAASVSRGGDEADTE